MTAPITASADARNRALRTVMQGLAIDVSVAVVLVLSTSVGDLHWTRAYWIALGLTLAKTVIQTGVAYAMRKLIPPGKEPIG